MSTEGVWRWNVDDVWQSYSSMYQEHEFSTHATNDIMRYHHVSACLLFGGCAIEAFLNTRMRNVLDREGKPEQTIFNKLRYNTLREKIEKWPRRIANTVIEEGDREQILEFLDLRNEVTHRKRRDHSLYKELDDAATAAYIEAVQRAFVKVFDGVDECFPYWILGWNFVGMNNDDTHPCLLNNGQFKHALQHMDFDVPAWDYYAAMEWERNHMRGLDGLAHLKREYYSRAPDIQPTTEWAPTAPRLCKRWWDQEFIRAS